MWMWRTKDGKWNARIMGMGMGIPGAAVAVEIDAWSRLAFASNMQVVLAMLR